MKPNVLIVGAGAVAHVSAHKCAQNNDLLGNVCIASRTQSKAEQIIESIKRKNNIKDKNARLYARFGFEPYEMPHRSACCNRSYRLQLAAGSG